jgi:glutamate-1-semialdehyde aminotransferase
MEIALKIINNIPCVKKVETNEEKIKCMDNRLYTLEQQLQDIYNKNTVDTKIARVNDTINLKLNNIETSNNLKFQSMQDFNEIRLKNIDDKQNDLKDNQSEIFHKIQRNADKLSTITGYLEQSSVSNALDKSMSRPRRRNWR